MDEGPPEQSFNNQIQTQIINSFIDLFRRNGINIPLNSNEYSMEEQIIHFFPSELNPSNNPNVINTNIPPSEEDAIVPSNLNEPIIENINSVEQHPDIVPSEENMINDDSDDEMPVLLQPGEPINIEDFNDDLDDIPDIPDFNDDREGLNESTVNISPLHISEILNGATYNIPINSSIEEIQNILRLGNFSTPEIEPNYLIEKFKEVDVGISVIEYPYEDLVIKIFVPTIIVIDKSFFRNLIQSQIINLKDILKEKETALQIAYFIKTGEITPEVQPHHDEISGYSKKPISKEEIKELSFKNIKDYEVFSTIDNSSICSICQIPILEAIEEDKEVVVLECGDYFCKECILKWLEQYQHKCPNCNKVLSKNEDVQSTRLTRDEILVNNYYKSAYFIINYCDYYRQTQNISVQKLNQLNELFIQQGGLISMNDCKALLEL